MNDLLKEFVAIISPPEKLANLKSAVLGGKNNISHNFVAESVSLDTKWIDEIEAAIFHIEKIVKEPKTFIKDEEYIVDVEKAKKTNSRTIRHLASHTRNIANVENGEVKPKRVLTIENDEDLAIYENRFIAALIDRLQIFVERRYKDINEKMTSNDITNLKMDSEFSFGEAEISYNLALVVKQPPFKTAEVKQNLDNLERINVLRKRLKILTSTDFFRRLIHLKPVRPPIAKTNIIKMNVDYNTAYKLWLYISSYTFLGYSVVTQNKNLPVDNDYYDDMILISSLSVKSLLDNDKKRKGVYDGVKLKPPKKKKYKVLTQVDLKPHFRQDNNKAREDSINEYYYSQIKEILKQAVEMPEDYDLCEQKELDVSFTKFVKALGEINFAMYEDIIRKHTYALTKKEDGTLKGKSFQIKQQEKIYQRYLMLSKLKSAELEKALRSESREYLKLEKMKADFDFDAARVEAESALPESEINEKVLNLDKEKENQEAAYEKIERAKKRQSARIATAEKKSKATLQKKVAGARVKTRDIKAELFLKEQQRLIDISERNIRRKAELQKRRAGNND